MVLVRLAYVADLPSPAELVRTAEGAAPATAPRGDRAAAASRPPLAPAPQSSAAAAVAVPLPAAEPMNPAPTAAARDPMPQSFAEVVALFDEKREAVLRAHLMAHVHLVHFEPGRIEFRAADEAPRDLANRLGQLLGEWTGARWVVAVSSAEGEPSLRQQEESRDRALRNEVAEHPLVRAVLETFPGATIAAVRERFASGEAEESEADDTGTEEDMT